MRARVWSLAMLALLTAAACADSDRKGLEALQQGGTLSLADITLQTREDTPVSGVARVQNDSGPITTQVVSQGSKGTLTFGPAGTSFTYTPNPDVNGDDTVVIAIADARTQAQATVHVTITPVDDPPALAGTTTLIMDEDSILNINLSDVLVVDTDSDVSHVSLTLLPSALYISSGNTLRPLPDFNGDLHVFVMLYDGIASAVVPLDVTVSPVNDAPVIAVPPPQRTAQDAPFTFSGSLAPAVHDVDAGAAPLAVTLSADQGTLTLAATSGLTLTTGTGTGDTTVVFSGSQADIDAALNGLVLTPPPSFTGIVTLTFTADDQGATGAGGPLGDSDTFTVGVGSVDLPPFNTLDSSAAIDEDTTLAFGTATNPIGVGDSDPGDTNAQVSLSVDIGTLTLSGTTGLAFTTGSGTADASMAFSGAITDINAALAGMVYTPSADYAGAVTLTMTSQTNSLSDSDTMTITVRAINDAPTVTGPTSLTAVTGTDLDFTGASTVVIGDVDASTGAMHVDISVADGTVSLAAVSGLTPMADSGTSYIADGTRLQLNSALAGMVFHPGAAGAATIDIVVNDNGNTGAGGPATGSLHIAITVSAPNEPPVAGADSYQTSGNTTLVVASAAAGVLANDNDPDGASVTLTTTGDIGTSQHGTVHLAADGTFTYDPPLGSSNVDDTFTYTIADSANATADGTVTISIGRAIWYVSNSAAASGDGRDGTPFQTIAAAVAAAASNSTIYVGSSADPYAGGITLASGQQLVGAGVDLPRDGNPTLTATTAPAITSNGGGSAAVITMGSNAQVRGITITPATPQSYPGISISGVTSVDIADVTIQNQAPQIAIADAPGPISMTRVELDSANGDALTVDTASAVTSTVSLSSSTIDGTTLGNGILSRATAGSIVMTLDTVTFEHIDTNGVDIASSGASSASLSCHACTLVNDDSNAAGDTAIRVVASGSGAIASFDVDSSLFDGWPGTAIAVEADDGGSTITGSLTSNTIASTIAGSWLIGGITVELDAADTTGGATGVALIEGNTLTLTGSGVPGIAAFTRAGASHRLDLTLTNNQITTASAEGIDVSSGAAATVCADFTQDTANGGFSLDATGTITLPQYGGGDLQTYFDGKTNSGTVTATGAGAIIDVAGCASPSS